MMQKVAGLSLGDWKTLSDNPGANGYYFQIMAV